jgi:hypothetical protein
MPNKNSRKNRIPMSVKIPKRKVVTINDLLTRDDLNGILKDLDKVKPYIKDCIVIYIDKRDDKYYWQITDNTLASMAVWLLESTKNNLLNAESED